MGATLDGKRPPREPEGLSHQIPSPLEGVFATMRTRSTLASVVLATASVALLAGCSGKPENSPAIRTKFAQYDKAAASVEALTTEVQSLQTQVAALVEENSALRAFAPTVNGTPAIEKINSLEARLSKVEGLAGQSIMTAATSAKSSAPAASAPEATTTTNANPDTLDTAPLAAAPAPKETAPAAVVASQQERPKTTAAPASSFRSMTNKPAETKPVAKATTKPAAKPTAAPAPAARGAYHTIETGDTLQGLSSKYSVSVDSILKANRIPQGARLARGQRLFIPQS